MEYRPWQFIEPRNKTLLPWIMKSRKNPLWNIPNIPWAGPRDVWNISLGSWDVSLVHYRAIFNSASPHWNIADKCLYHTPLNIVYFSVLWIVQSIFHNILTGNIVLVACCATVTFNPVIFVQSKMFYDLRLFDYFGGKDDNVWIQTLTLSTAKQTSIEEKRRNSDWFSSQRFCVKFVYNSWPRRRLTVQIRLLQGT